MTFIPASAPTGYSSAAIPGQQDMEPVRASQWAHAAGSQQAAAPKPPVPAITNVSPTTGSSGGGTAVTITGTGFTKAWGAVIEYPCTAFTVVSDTSITCTTAAGGRKGNVPVMVLLGTQILTAPQLFTRT